MEPGGGGPAAIEVIPIAGEDWGGGSILPEDDTEVQIHWSLTRSRVTVKGNVPPDVLGVFVSTHAAVRAVADDTG